MVVAVVVVVVVIVFIVSTLIARRRGYPVGGATVVRCSKGHLFTTIWIPGASFKAVRLGSRRFQRCPVGKHWSLVRPVRTGELTDEEDRIAHQIRDTRVP